MKSFLLLRRQMTHRFYCWRHNGYLHWLTLLTCLTHVPWWVLQRKAGTLMIWLFWGGGWKMSTSNLLELFFSLYSKTQTHKFAVSFQLTSWTGGETRLKRLFSINVEKMCFFSGAHTGSPSVGCCTSIILHVKKGKFYDWRATLIFGRRRWMCSVFTTPAGNYQRTIKSSWTN